MKIFERRVGQKKKREYKRFSQFYGTKVHKTMKGSFFMEHETTVSVRLCETEYRALQARAKEEYTSMSSILRKLIHSLFESEEKHNG